MTTNPHDELLKKLETCEELVQNIDPILRSKAFEICFDLLFKHELSTPETVKLTSTKQNSSLSLPELIMKSKAKIHTNKILIVSYYLFYIKKMNEFNVNHIKESLQDARQPLPGNPNNLLNGLINRGLLMKAPKDVDGLKGFRITQTGIDEVNRMLEEYC